jgi:SAM-dependent methyltransferase
MKAEYASAYSDLYRRHWWWRAREALLLRELARHAPPGGWETILDVGCGNGLFFDRLRAFGEPWGVEVDASLVSADSPHRNRIHIGAFDDSFTAPAPIGLVLMLDVLEHLQRPVEALRRAAALLAPGGSVLITVPAFQALWTAHDELNQHVVRYTRASLQRVVREAGLVPASLRYLFHWLFPAKLGVRAVEAVARTKPSPATVPSPLLNRILYAWCRVEERGLAWARLPFGTSILAWCVHAPERAVVRERSTRAHLGTGGRG